MKLFYDWELDRIITESELKNEFLELKKDDSTESKTFQEYILNCTSKNGTLSEINDYFLSNYSYKLENLQ